MQADKENITIVQTNDPGDFAVCAQIMVATDPWVTLGMNYDGCLRSFDGDFKEVFVLKKEDKIAGFVIMQTQGSFKGYIQTFAVGADHRGKGYGTLILEFCEQRIHSYSPNIFICVSSFNHGALALYQRFGFELVGELKNFVKDGFTELLLRKTIGPMMGYKPNNKE